MFCYTDSMVDGAFGSEKLSQSWSDCILYNGQKGMNPLVAKKKTNSLIVCKLMRKMAQLLIEWITSEFMVSIASFKFSSTQHDVHFVSYGCIYIE